MQALTDGVRVLWPGVVIYGIGDAAHAAESSDHNEDDTPGRRTPQTDSDNLPEHRAIDVMLGSRFSAADGHALVAALLGVPANRARLSLVIYAGFEYSRRTGFVKVARTRDRHDDHVHASGLAADDDNTAPWILNGDVEEMKEILALGPDGTIYRSNFHTSVPAGDVTPAHLPHLRYVAGQMGVVLAHGPGDDAEWTWGGWLRKGWSPEVFGPVVAATSAPAPEPISQEQVDAAVLQALGSARFDTRVVLPE
jgi:hypothetical protein